MSEPLDAVSGAEQRRALWRDLGLWFRLSVACAVVLFAAFHLRDLAVNLAIPLDSDEAQYVGAARDYLESGQFLESTHNQSIPYFMPLGYPALTVAAAKLLGYDAHKAALTVNLALGTVLAVMVLLFAYRLTESLLAALLAGLWAAFSWPLVELSAQAMTDISYILVFLAIAWLLWEYFWGMKGRLFLPFCLLLGLLFGAMYMIRVSAIYMLGAVPLVCLWVNWRRRRMPWQRMLVGLALFMALGLAVVLGNALRWQQLNGYFTLSPQVAGNLSIGNYESKGEYDLFRVHETGNTTVRRYQQRHGQTVAEEWKDPLPRVRIMAENVLINLEFIWFGLWGWKLETGLMGLGLALLVVALALIGQGRRARAGNEAVTLRPYAQGERLWLALSLLGGLTLVHLLTYSVAVHFRRYMIQVTPFAIVLAAAAMHWLVWRVYQRHYPGRAGGAFMLFGVPAGAFVPKLVMVEGQNDKDRSYLTIEAVPKVVVRGWVLLAVAVLGISLIVGLQGQQALQSATDRDVYSTDRAKKKKKGGGYGDVPHVAQTMGERAQEAGQQVRVAADSWSVAYYAQGTGFPIPYTEDRPQMVWRYLASNRINFVYGSNRIDFGTKVTGVPLYFMLNALARYDQPWVAKRMEGPYFQLLDYPRLTPQGRLERLEDSLSLQPGRLYLLHAAFLGEGRRGKVVSDRVLFALEQEGQAVREVAGDLCPGPDLVPHNLPLPLGNLLVSRTSVRKENVDWNLFLALRPEETGQARLVGVPRGKVGPLRQFKGATLYLVEEDAVPPASKP